MRLPCYEKPLTVLTSVENRIFALIFNLLSYERIVT
jgi:hypothetical protein